MTRYVAREYERFLREPNLVNLLDNVAVNTDNADCLRDDDVPEVICVARETLLDRLHEAPDVETAKVIVRDFIHLCQRAQRNERMDFITLTKYVLRNLDVDVCAADTYIKGEILGVETVLDELGFEPGADGEYKPKDRKYVKGLLKTLYSFWRNPDNFIIL